MVAPVQTVPKIAQTQSREWAPREERVDCHASGRLRRAAAVVLVSTMTAEVVVVKESVSHLGRNGCRGAGVAR